MSKYLIVHSKTKGTATGNVFRINDSEISFSLEDKQVIPEPLWTKPIVTKEGEYTIQNMSNNVDFHNFTNSWNDNSSALYRAVKGSKVKFRLLPEPECTTEIEINVPDGMDIYEFQKWLKNIRKEKQNLIDKYYKNKPKHKQSFFGAMWNILNVKNSNNRSSASRKDKVK